MSVTFRQDVERAIQNRQWANIERLIPNDASQDLLGLVVLDIIRAGQPDLAGRLLGRLVEPWGLAEAFMAAAEQGYRALVAQAAQANREAFPSFIRDAAQDRALRNGHTGLFD